MKKTNSSAHILLAILASVTINSIQAAPTILSNATLFRGDATGNNLNGGSTVFYGAWTTVRDQQNIPGNYGSQLFLAQTPNPTPANFLSPSAAVSIPLSPGANTLYFWGSGDDTRGGSATFGINLFFNGAGAVSPSLSAYTMPGAGQTVNANSSPHTAGYDFGYTSGAGTLSFTDGSQIITLSSFEITGVGGAAAGPGNVDLVNGVGNPTTPFTPPAQPDGIADTYGRFVLTVTTVPEPSTTLLGAIGLLGMLSRRFRNGRNA